MALLKTGQFAELSAAVIRSLPRGVDPSLAQEWIQNPKALEKALRQALNRPLFQSFSRVKLGTDDKTVLVERLQQQVYEVTERARDTISQPALAVASQETSVQLVLASVGELECGLSSYWEVCERAQEFGLKLCTPEVGLQVLLQCPDQIRDKSFRIGMACIIGSGSCENYFRVGRDDKGLFLDASCRCDDGYGYALYDLDSQFIFCK